MRVPNWMLAMALAATALLSACGGGSSNDSGGDATSAFSTPALATHRST